MADIVYPLDRFPQYVQDLAVWINLTGGVASFILCSMSIVVFRFCLPSLISDRMWPNKLVYWLNVVDLLHSFEPLLITTRDSGYKIPCYIQYWVGQACHLGSIAFATFISIEVFRSIVLQHHLLTPKYKKAYIGLGMGYTMGGATLLLLLGEDWSCEPANMLECPNTFVSAAASYCGCYILQKYLYLRMCMFYIPALAMAVVCVVCFGGCMMKIRSATDGATKGLATQRLLVITGTTMFLLIVPVLYRIAQSVNYAPGQPDTTSAYIIIYHSIGNGWNGAVNVLLAWWRLGIYAKLKDKYYTSKAGEDKRGSSQKSKGVEVSPQREGEAEGEREDSVSLSLSLDAMCEEVEGALGEREGDLEREREGEHVVGDSTLSDSLDSLSLGYQGEGEIVAGDVGEGERELVVIAGEMGGESQGEKEGESMCIPTPAAEVGVLVTPPLGTHADTV
ncbi:hypothetical protein KIPB_007146 [Kipferlia bialata]|uniref:G-protein coupled receptors family 1 profile domain-containing protein n=1 Tax=Kipferlia bialata TaxID=797122 RepID=A0A9K3CZW4_9EUKA|nr:hypothetical protein KIPB_007146 [Kipferlia bialata]|eukprot:g7146.t1